MKKYKKYGSFWNGCIATAAKRCAWGNVETWESCIWCRGSLEFHESLCNAAFLRVAFLKNPNLDVRASHDSHFILRRERLGWVGLGAYCSIVNLWQLAKKNFLWREKQRVQKFTDYETVAEFSLVQLSDRFSSTVPFASQVLTRMRIIKRGSQQWW